MFADTHVHSVMKYVHLKRDNLWKSFGGQISIVALLNNLIGIPAFSQADMRRLAKGNFQIIFCALHPPEQKIVYTKFDGPLGDVVDDVAAQIISIPDERIREFRKPAYDHYQQLQKELDLLIEQEGSSRKVFVDGKRKKCSYKVTRNFQEVQEVIEFNKQHSNEHKIAIVLTVEGLHSIGRGHLDFDNQANPMNVDDDTFMARIDRMKGLANDQGAAWIHTPILANLTHAFDNGICGHAQALAEGMRKCVFKYAEEYSSNPVSGGLNKPLSALGKLAVERMLGIDQVSQERVNTGKRIIPDIKHMSVKTRRDYYEIIDTHNAANPNDVIPVVMSHAAVNGKVSASADNNYDPKDTDDDYKNSATFNTFSINLYDDEIIKVHETKGLMGIIFDERVLSGGKKLKLLEKYINNNEDYDNPYKALGYNDRRTWLTLITDQIEHIVKTTITSNTTTDKKLIWDRICIGSDFDGQIDPINGYKKSKDFPQFKKDLKFLLSKDKFSGLLLGHTVDEVVNKICFENVYGFLEKNWG